MDCDEFLCVELEPGVVRSDKEVLLSELSNHIDDEKVLRIICAYDNIPIVSENLFFRSLQRKCFLSRAAVGISLMESPHPSYPPLEMASSGCVTFTNSYECKDMTNRSKNILSLDELSPVGLMQSIEKAFEIVNIGSTCVFDNIKTVDTRVLLISYKEICLELYCKLQHV